MAKRKRREASSRPPSTLYHYTTADGLLSMLRTGHIWATDASYMNDPHELRYGFDCLALVAQRHARFRRVAAQLRSLIEDVARQKIVNGRIYLASFSRDGDLLSQWRAYGGNGGGFAIGLASRVLRATAGDRGALARKLPAVEIVCGPTVSRELGVKALRELCESLGYCVVIKGSRESRTKSDKRPRLILSASATPFVS